MKKTLLAASLVGLALLVAGCSPNVLVPVVKEGDRVEVIYADGQEAALSKTDNTTVAVSGIQSEEWPSEFFFLHIGLQNRSSEEMTVVPEDIKVTAYRGTETKLLKVYSAEEYVKRLQGLTLSTGLLQALALGVASAPAYHSYSPNLAMQTSFQNVLITGNTAEIGRQEVKSAEQVVLKRTTVLPGQFIEGLVVIKYDEDFCQQYKITIPFGPDTHEFDFMLVKKPSGQGK